jgi:hypothetical protein
MPLDQIVPNESPNNENDLRMLKDNILENIPDID